MKCCACGKTVETKQTKAGNDRLPKSWKRHDGIYCPACWSERYCLRAITIPVKRPLGDGGWPELREALKESWSETTAATNWIMSQLFVRDEHRDGQKKMPKMPKAYLYPELRKRFPRLPSQVCASLENAIKAKYSRKRYEIIWTCESSLPSARYPQPAIAPSQAVKLTYESAGKDGGDLVPCVSLPLLSGERFTLQLQGGREFRRQLGDFRRLVDGQAIAGEVAIMRKRVGNDAKNGIKGRDGGGQQFATRIMLKIAGWFPRQIKEAEGTLFVRSDSDCFLVALDKKASKLRVWNSDHVRRWISEHRRQLQRWSDDQKAEQRQPRRKHATFQSRREATVNKFRNRIDSHIKETAAQIAGVVQRMKFSVVKLSLSDRSYFGEGRFDWSGFETYLKQRLNQIGVTLELASGDVMPDFKGPLVETKPK